MIAVTQKIKTQKAWLVLGLLAFGAFVVLPATAQAQSRDVTSRLNRLENEIQTLNRAVYRGEKPSSPVLSGDPAANAAAEVRIQQLEMELRDIRGKIEEQSYQIRQLTEKLDRAVGDLEVRMSDLEGGRSTGGAANSTSSYVAGGAKFTPPISGKVKTQRIGNGQSDDFTWSSNAANTAPAAGNQLGTISSGGDAAAAAYENAFSLLKNSNYEAAGKGFDAFINQNPNHALVGNAKYWLGETYYVRGDYSTAARIFAEGYQKFPKGTKAADNLLKLGMSLAATGSKADACIAFSQLKKDFSAGAGSVLRRADQEMSRIGCT